MSDIPVTADDAAAVDVTQPATDTTQPPQPAPSEDATPVPTPAPAPNPEPPIAEPPTPPPTPDPPLPPAPPATPDPPATEPVLPTPPATPEPILPAPILNPNPIVPLPQLGVPKVIPPPAPTLDPTPARIPVEAKPESAPLEQPTPEAGLVTEAPAEPTLAPMPETKPEAPPATPISPSDIPPAVLALTDDELRIAAAYYLRKHQTELSRKGVTARQQKMQRNLAAIEAYIKKRGSAQIPRLTQQFNLSPVLVSKYMQTLVKEGRVRAEGHGSGRRYFI